MPYIIFHPSGEITMPEELPNVPDVATEANERIEEAPEVTVPETITDETVDDYEEELNAAFRELHDRLAACEEHIRELEGRDNHEPTGNGREETTETTHTETEDRSPEPTHWYFRRIGKSKD